MKDWVIKLTILASIAALTACSLAPPYHRPDMSIPIKYKEYKEYKEYKKAGKWLPAKPGYADTRRGPWWEVFGDPKLNALEEKVSVANQDLKAALARYQEACAAAAAARSAYYPTVRGVVNADRQQTSGNIANKNPISLFSDILVGAALTYEVDVWGRVRNLVAASENRARASAADLAALDLSLHAELANDYFALRGDDASQRVLDALVVAYRKALFLVRKRHQGGIASELDVDEAETQYENTKTLAADTRLKRAQLEHAIAVLNGEPPADFTLKPVVPTRIRIKPHFISIGPDLPSILLERRPDIAASERRVEAANAEIGVARAAYFPDFNLLAAGGVESATFPKLFSMPSLFWALGSAGASALLAPAASIVLLDGGNIRALLNEANASYYETVALYRQTVLTAFQEVEDNLVASHQLKQEYHSQTAATKAAERALIQAQQRYFGGIITYLDVIILQNTALQSELALIDIHTRRQIASVQLIRALGGGWQAYCSA
jgi:NodT family efflux transporter outer membrane factor (OMF) lipoprotein